MVVMNSKKSKRQRISEGEIDKIVESQAEKDSAWERPIKVRRAKSTALSLPADLAARAAFLARLHREKNVEEWLSRIIKERVELEEVAFSEAKRAMSDRNGA
jgi:hypothetical protein